MLATKSLLPCMIPKPTEACLVYENTRSVVLDRHCLPQFFHIDHVGVSSKSDNTLKILDIIRALKPLVIPKVVLLKRSIGSRYIWY